MSCNATLLTHIAQVGNCRTMEHLVNPKLRHRLAQVFEESSPTAEHYGHQGDFQLVDNTQVQVLLDHIRAACDPDIATARRLPGLPQGTFRSVVDEVEGRTAR